MIKRQIYIAAPWINKADALIAQRKFEAAGHKVISSWITKHTDVDDENDPKHFEELKRQAMEDLNEVAVSDTFVILNLGKSEGKATELGYALYGCGEWGMPTHIYLVGEPSINIFYHLPDVQRFDTVEEVIECLKKS